MGETSSVVKTYIKCEKEHDLRRHELDQGDTSRALLVANEQSRLCPPYPLFLGPLS